MTFGARPFGALPFGGITADAGLPRQGGVWPIDGLYKPQYAGHSQDDREALRRAREALEPVSEPVQKVIESVANHEANGIALMQALSEARLEYKALYLDHMELLARQRFLDQQEEELGVVMTVMALLQ
jgi:hypothetical protein